MQESFKFCPACRAQNNLSAQFCQKCGLQYTDTPPQTSESERSEPSNKILGIVISILGFLFLSFIGIDPIDLWSRPETVVELATGVNAGMTLANYERLTTGMTYAQVCGILGKNGTEMSRSEMLGTVTVMYEWQGNGLANMNAMFQNGKLVSKAQFGLK